MACCYCPSLEPRTTEPRTAEPRIEDRGSKIAISTTGTCTAVPPWPPAIPRTEEPKNHRTAEPKIEDRALTPDSRPQTLCNGHDSTTKSTSALLRFLPCGSSTSTSARCAPGASCQNAR